ncbi:MAG TPA: ribonuclease III [Bacteroidia bacterium]|nr:ribonuclease III [Bacteroidia bacterium]
MILNFFKYFIRSSEEKNLISSLKNLTGFYPGNLSVYKLAFSHKSVAKETNKGIKLSNERLEFLGDAVLGSVVAELLFKRFPYRDEGFLTEMRSKIVSRENLKTLAMKIGIDKMVQKDVSGIGFRSMYGDAFEALIGAIYLDKGYKTAQKFILERIIRIHLDLNEMEATEMNFKSKVLNWGQKEKHNVVFETLEENSTTRLIKVRLLIDEKEVATGQDFSKKKAEQIAAEAACEQLGI